MKYKTFSFISYNLKISPKFYLVAHISFIPTLLFSFTSPYQILFLCLLLFSFWLLHLFVCPHSIPIFLCLYYYYFFFFLIFLLAFIFQKFSFQISEFELVELSFFNTAFIYKYISLIVSVCMYICIV